MGVSVKIFDGVLKYNHFYYTNFPLCEGVKPRIFIFLTLTTGTKGSLMGRKITFT
jgi:hypothetical protein